MGDCEHSDLRFEFKKHECVWESGGRARRISSRMLKKAVQQGRSRYPFYYGVAGMIPIARVQRGPSEAARCASTGIVPVTPALFSAPCYDR